MEFFFYHKYKKDFEREAEKEPNQISFLKGALWLKGENRLTMGTLGGHRELQSIPERGLDEGDAKWTETSRWVRDLFGSCMGQDLATDRIRETSREASRSTSRFLPDIRGWMERVHCWRSRIEKGSHGLSAHA